MPSNDEQLALAFERLAVEAGNLILEIRAASPKVEQKADFSPVTEADRRAEAHILEGLATLLPGVPVVAEEEAAAGRSPASLDGSFLLVDPLDGTKEFIAGERDFTVNIALIRAGVPEIGAVCAPDHGLVYLGRPGAALEIETGGGRRRRAIAVRRSGDRPTILASRRHLTAETQAFLDRHDGCAIMNIGSSLKFCMLAAGKADLYPRFGRTMEWDTAAGDAVLRAAGGITRVLDGSPLAYGKRDQPDDADFANPWFIASADPEAPI